MDCKSAKCILALNKARLDKIKVCNNLNYKILQEASNLEIVIRAAELEKELLLEEQGTEIVDLLNTEDANNFCKEKKMNIFFLDQIVETTENKLLTWGQIKRIREVQTKGKRPKWFKKLENQILENED